MAGFAAPLFLLGLGAGARAGYRNPLPVPPYGVPSEERAGFRGPLPIPSLGADAEERAGYPTPLPLYFGYAGEEDSTTDPPTPPDVQFSGGGRFIRYGRRKKKRPDDILFLTPHGG